MQNVNKSATHDVIEFDWAEPFGSCIDKSAYWNPTVRILTHRYIYILYIYIWLAHIEADSKPTHLKDHTAYMIIRKAGKKPASNERKEEGPPRLYSD